MKTIFASFNVLRLLTVSALLNDTTCCGLMIGISFGWKLLTQFRLCQHFNKCATLSETNFLFQII